MATTAARTKSGKGLAAEASDATIFFPHGLVGFEDWKRFVLLVDDCEELPVATLQSLDTQEVALLVSDPLLLVPDYRVLLSPEDREDLGLGPEEEPVVYCTLTLAKDGWLTANLLGPLAINPATRQAKQIVLADLGYSTRHQIAQLPASDGSRARSEP